MATRGIAPDGDAETHGRGRRQRRAIIAAMISAALVALPAFAATAEGAPLGEWRFDEPAGDVALDGGPYGLDGRLGRAEGADDADPVRIAGAGSGAALLFDGGDIVRLPDAPELSPATITAEAVVRAPASPGLFRYVISRGGRGCFAGSYGLYTGAAGGMAFYVFDGSRYVVSAAAAPEAVWDGAWHHVAGTFNGERLRLYVDGRPVGTPSEAVMEIDYVATSQHMAFGRYVGTCDLSFKGDLDLVRLQSGALSRSALEDAARREIPGVEAGDQPLPPGAPPTTITAVAPNDPPEVTPGAPARACALAVSRTRIVARRSTAVAVRVTVRGKPVRAVRVTAHERGKPIAAARTRASGTARLVIRPRRRGELKIRAAVRPACSAGSIRVARPR